MKKVKYKDYRMAAMELFFKARQMSDNSISVYEDMAFGSNIIKLGINWAGCGTKTPEETEKFAVTLIKVVQMVESFPYLGYEVEYEEAPKVEVSTKQYETKEEVRKEIEKAIKANGITEKEEKVLRTIIAESNFNCNSLDVSKSWEEQSLEDPDAFWAFADVKDYGCGMTKGQTRGIFGSLSKKNLIELVEDESEYGKPFTWIIIREENFNNIKKVLNR